jgi:hypothetical protein
VASSVEQAHFDMFAVGSVRGGAAVFEGGSD